MKNTFRQHRGMTSALALIYLAVIAVLAVGFYTAVDLGSSVADNEQNINRSSTASEVGLAFARYQLSSAQLSIPGPVSSSNFFTGAVAKITSNLSGTTNMSGVNPTTQPSGSPAALAIPGQVNGTQTWMNTDSAGGQVYLTVTPVNGTTNLQVLAVARNSNSRVTPITRKSQLTFTGSASVYTFGLVSYGEIFLNGGLTVNGTSAGVLAITPTGTKPINVVGSNTFAGDFYWTNNTAYTAITWGSLKVDGYLSSSGQFKNHVHSSTPTPVAPTFDTSGYVQYVNSTTYGNGPLTPGSMIGGVAMGNVTALTNASLAAGTYIFANPITLNGILYLQSGANVTFDKGVTLNGSIVQANGAATGTLVVDGALTQTSIASLSGPDFPAGELALTGTALLLPNYNITFNSTLNTVGSVIGGNMIFNANTTVNGGSVINMGSSSMIFNSTATLTINTATSTPSGTNMVFTANPASYTEVYP